MNRYHHKVFNIALGQKVFDGMDTNYELVKIVPYTMYESVAVFIEHNDPESAPSVDRSEDKA